MWGRTSTVAALVAALGLLGASPASAELGAFLLDADKALETHRPQRVFYQLKGHRVISERWYAPTGEKWTIERAKEILAHITPQKAKLVKESVKGGSGAIRFDYPNKDYATVYLKDGMVTDISAYSHEFSKDKVTDIGMYTAERSDYGAIDFGVSYINFLKIRENHTTYKDAHYILGISSDEELVSSSSSGGVTLEMYKWTSKEGGVIVATFQDGILIGKSQAGLK